VLVSGATGFIGQHLVPLLLQAGHEVVALARDAERARRFEWYEHVRFVTHDLDADAPLPAVQPKQCSATRIASPAGSRCSRSRRWADPPARGSCSCWLKSQSKSCPCQSTLISERHITRSRFAVRWLARSSAW
jgi:hypothetical protein